MHVAGRGGFALIEVLVALAVLSVGILALVGSSAVASRMVGRGAVSTRIALRAAARVDHLRQIAFATVPPCTAAEWRSGSASGSGLTERWELLDATGPVRRVRIVLDSRHPAGTSSDTVMSGLLCGLP